MNNNVKLKKKKEFKKKLCKHQMVNAFYFIAT